MAESIYIPTGAPDVFAATELARGPWDPDAQHGGAPAALLMRAFEQLPAADGLQTVRITYELLRPVPIAPLRLHAEVVRGGKRVQLLEASLWTEDGTEIVRARALQTAAAQAPTSPSQAPPPGPADGQVSDLTPPYAPMFAPDAMEIRFVEGQFSPQGPATGWFRLRVPLVPDEKPSPLQRLAAAGDFGNGISTPLSWDTHMFINPDLTLYVERPPEGEWIALRSRTRIAPGGIGIAESELFDTRGWVGRAIQALLVGPRARP